MSFKDALKALEELEALGTKRKAKVELLQGKAGRNPVLQQIFLLAYDWQRTFGMRVLFHVAGESGAQRTKPLFGAAAQDKREPWEAFVGLLDKLASRELTGNAAKEAWSLLVARCSQQEHQWFSRIINRDLKIGIDRPTVELVWPDLIKPFGVQLAKSMKDVDAFEPTKKEPWLRWPVWVEPKMDGMRVVIEYNHKTKTCTGFSREGHMLTEIQGLLDLLVPVLDKRMGRSCWVDSEALAVEKTAEEKEEERKADEQAKKKSAQDSIYNQTMSLIRSDDPAKQLRWLQFHCFDLVGDVSSEKTVLSERRESLRLMSTKPEWPGASFVLTPSTKVSNDEHLQEIYNEYLEQGFEGVMVKFDAPYRAKRTAAWLKLKPTETVDAMIVGFEPGKQGSKHEHHLGAIVVQRGDTGKMINVGGGYSDEQRRLFWGQREHLMGKVLEFKEEKRSGASTTANFPRFVRMRPDREKA